MVKQMRIKNKICPNSAAGMRRSVCLPLPVALSGEKPHVDDWILRDDSTCGQRGRSARKSSITSCVNCHG
jgi:hypothetical protein